MRPHAYDDDLDVESSTVARVMVNRALAVHGGEREELVVELAKALIEQAAHELAAAAMESAAHSLPCAESARARAASILAPQLFGSTLKDDVVSCIKKLEFDLNVREKREVRATAIFTVNQRKVLG